MAAGVDRLSGLSDDVLRRILRFAPAREAASTNALSKRWTTHSSPLWLGSGAVNLDICLSDRYEHSRYDSRRSFYGKRNAIVSRVHQALDAALKAGAPVTRLTFRVEAQYCATIKEFLHGDASWRKKEKRDVVDGVISHRAARRVEELRIAAVESSGAVRSANEVYPGTRGLGIFRLRLASLPSETLRVLDLTSCSGLELPPSANAFPRLASLRLHHCSVPLEVIQAVIDSAPVLAVIHLESVLFEKTNSDSKQQLSEGRRLSCPAAAVLVLDTCGWMKEGCVEIDAPRLRRFRYKGNLRQIFLTPPSPDLTLADLTLLDYTSKDARDVLKNFWRFVRSYTHTKEMKLRVRNLEEIAVASEARRVQLLPEFRKLERLEVEGVHRPTGKTAAVAIANLLRCCPALHDLRIKLTKTERSSWHGHDFLKKKYSSDLQDSIDRFKQHRSEPMAAGFKRHRSEPMAGDGDDDGKYEYDDVSDIPALSGRSFECLRSSLRRVGLQFRQQKTDCFGVKLIKFFAENSMVLEEMCIDSGTEKLCAHLNPKVETWVSNSSKRRKVDSTKAKDFAVSPLERRN